MKILFFADTHGDKKTLNKLIKRGKNVDLIVCAGDFTQMENDIEKILDHINSFNKPVLIIHGNHEKLHININTRFILLEL